MVHPNFSLPRNYLICRACIISGSLVLSTKNPEKIILNSNLIMGLPTIIEKIIEKINDKRGFSLSFRRYEMLMFRTARGEGFRVHSGP